MALSPDLPSNSLSTATATAVLKHFDIPDHKINDQRIATLQLLATPTFYQRIDSPDKIPEYGFRTATLTGELGYAENTRENVRPTINLFCQHGILNKVVPAANSPHTHYHLTTDARTVLDRDDLETYLTLPDPDTTTPDTVTLPYHNGEFQLSPGTHSELIHTILTDLVPKLTTDPTLIHHDLDDHERDDVKNSKLPITIPGHPDTIWLPVFPDTIIYDNHENQLLIIEAVVTSGPVKEQRKQTITMALENAGVDLDEVSITFVSAFVDKTTYQKHALDIASNTWYWVKTAPKEIYNVKSKTLNEGAVL